MAWGIEPVMSRAEQEGLAYLFRLRMTANVKRALTKMMAVNLPRFRGVLSIWDQAG